MLLQASVVILLFLAIAHYRLSKRRIEYRTAVISKQMERSLELKKTLAMGLYFRFRDEFKNNNGNPTHYSKMFIKQTPIQFETFVAHVLETYHGGDTWVSPASGDYGVDFEHRRKDGLYLGQVKCYKNDLSYEPIALLHSNMVKAGAKGGYVITTGSFTENARQFASGLNIELIDGVKLVEYWLDGLKQTENTIAQWQEAPSV
jgi:restriction system protein